MPFCTYCGQSFTRDEHLERHILTHTNIKPYKCLTCHMSFARRDLLQRHYVVHGKYTSQDEFPGADGFLTKAAGRTPIACHNCARNKTKCDKKFPCTRCATRDLTCTVRPTRRITKNGGLIPQPEEGYSKAFRRCSSSTSHSQAGHVSPSVRAGVAQQEASISHRSSHDNSWEFSEQTSGRNESPGKQETEMQMQSIYGHGHDQMLDPSLEDASPVFDGTDLCNMVRDPDGFAGPRLSPLLPDDHSMLHWFQMPFVYDSSKTPNGFLMSSSMETGPNIFEDHDDFRFEFKCPAPIVDTSTEQPHEQFLQSSGPFSVTAHSPEAYTMHPEPTQQSANDMYNHGYMGRPVDLDPMLLEALSAAHDAWSVFRCNPCVPSSDCPKTARLNLETLERSLKSHQTWIEYTPTAQEMGHVGSHEVQVIPLQDMLRDKLMVITQTFLHKALDIHKAEPGVLDIRNSSNFVLLPPTRVLQFFLLRYTQCFEQYYSITPKSTLDANDLLRSNDDRAASILILLMIALGASVSTGEGQSLTAGIVEACRISLFDVVERNIMMASDHVVLMSALVFTVHGAWSGDKWQMDIAMGQRGLYINMLRHSGRLEPKAPKPPANHPIDAKMLWNEWIEQESRSRLIYAWAIVDQETSLFHDTAPLLSTIEFGEAMPSPDILWDSRTLNEWSKAFEELYEDLSTHTGIGANSKPLSLRGLFRHFLDDGIVAKRIELTPLQLRLLLHPLQALVHQSRQLLSCFPDKTATRRGSKTVSAASTRAQLKEASTLLQRWHGLADRYMKTKPLCPAMRANLVIYHLINLNAHTNFNEIERLARRDEGELTDQRLPMLRKRCISDAEEAIVHCGQVLRHIRLMAPAERPPWWAGAIYRVALILWTVSLDNGNATSQDNGAQASYESSFAVDATPPQDPVVARYLQHGEGIPLLSKQDGSMLAIENPLTVLLYCTQVIAEGVPTRFTDGLRLKLTSLARDGSR